MRVECARTMTQGPVSHYFLPIILHPHLWANPKLFSSALRKVLSSYLSQAALRMESGGENPTTGSPRDQMTFTRTLPAQRSNLLWVPSACGVAVEDGPGERLCFHPGQILQVLWGPTCWHSIKDRQPFSQGCSDSRDVAAAWLTKA